MVFQQLNQHKPSYYSRSQESMDFVKTVTHHVNNPAESELESCATNSSRNPECAKAVYAVQEALIPEEPDQTKRVRIARHLKDSFGRGPTFHSGIGHGFYDLISECNLRALMAYDFYQYAAFMSEKLVFVLKKLSSFVEKVVDVPIWQELTAGFSQAEIDAFIPLLRRAQTLRMRANDPTKAREWIRHTPKRELSMSLEEYTSTYLRFFKSLVPPGIASMLSNGEIAEPYVRGMVPHYKDQILEYKEVFNQIPEELDVLGIKLFIINSCPDLVAPISVPAPRPYTEPHSDASEYDFCEDGNIYGMELVQQGIHDLVVADELANLDESSDLGAIEMRDMEGDDENTIRVIQTGPKPARSLLPPYEDGTVDFDDVEIKYDDDGLGSESEDDMEAYTFNFNPLTMQATF